MMWIRTQSGKTILNSANIAYIHFSNGIINAMDINNTATSLGRYHDDKDAHAVLTKFLKAEAASVPYFEIPPSDYVLNNDTGMHEDLKRDLVYAIRKLNFYFPNDNIDIHIEPGSSFKNTKEILDVVAITETVPVTTE